MLPGRSSRTTLKVAILPSAASPLSRHLPSMVVSMLPPHSTTTTLRRRGRREEGEVYYSKEEQREGEERRENRKGKEEGRKEEGNIWELSRGGVTRDDYELKGMVI